MQGREKAPKAAPEREAEDWVRGVIRRILTHFLGKMVADVVGRGRRKQHRCN